MRSCLQSPLYFYNKPLELGTLTATMGSRAAGVRKKGNRSPDPKLLNPFLEMAQMPTVLDVLTAKASQPIANEYANGRVVDTMLSHVKRECLKHVERYFEELYRENSELKQRFKAAQDTHYNKLFSFIKQCDAASTAENLKLDGAFAKLRDTTLQTQERITAQQQVLLERQRKIYELEAKLESLNAQHRNIIDYEHGGGVQLDLKAIQRLQDSIAPIKTRHETQINKIRKLHEDSVQIALWHLDSVMGSIESKAADDILQSAKPEQLKEIVENKKLQSDLEKTNSVLAAHNEELDRLIQENVRESVAGLVVDWNMNYTVSTEEDALEPSRKDMLADVEDLFATVESGMAELQLDLEDLQSQPTRVQGDKDTASIVELNRVKVGSIPTLVSEDLISRPDLSSHIILNLEHTSWIQKQRANAARVESCNTATNYQNAQTSKGTGVYSRRNFNG